MKKKKARKVRRHMVSPGERFVWNEEDMKFVKRVKPRLLKIGSSDG